MVASSHIKTARALAKKGRVRESIQEIDRALTEELDEADRVDLKQLRLELVDRELWAMVKDGKATWAGGKPRGGNPPVEITPGPPVSDLIHEMRR